MERTFVMNAVTPTAPLTRRATRKIAAHKRLLQIAKAVFVEKGYEEATMRSIAVACGRSTGLIFGHVGNKEELFAAVLDADCKEYVEEMRKAATAEGEVLDILTRFFVVDYFRQAEQVQLVRDKLSLWWRNEENTTRHMLNFRNETELLVEEILERAVSRGELRSDTQLDLLSEMLWDAYIVEYQNYALSDHDLATQARIDAFRAKATVILAGSRGS